MLTTHRLGNLDCSRGITPFRFLIGLLICISSFAAASIRCVHSSKINYAPGVHFKVWRGLIFVEYKVDGQMNRQLITGDEVYSSAGIAYSLGFDLEQIPFIANPSEGTGAPIDFLLIGMSYTSLLPSLLKKGYMVHALDLWYNQPKIPSGSYSAKMKAFNQEFKDHLISADALNMPIATESVANAVSFRVVSAQNSEFHRKFLEENVRIVIPYGGQVRVSGFEEHEAAIAYNYLKAKYGGTLDIRVHRREITWVYPDNTEVSGQVIETSRHVNFSNDYLLLITKKQSTAVDPL